MSKIILDSEEEVRKKRFFTPLAVFFILILVGGIFGASTNAINGWVSEYYFQKIMGWQFEGIWKAAISQGIFEGTLYGIILGLVYSFAFALITRLSGSIKFAILLIRKIIPILYGSWVFVGLLAVIFILVAPDIYSNIFRHVPETINQRLGFAWVGGSIWGGMAGGVISLFYLLVKTTSAWSKAKFDS